MLVSDPEHVTEVILMGPLPWPKGVQQLRETAPAQNVGKYGMVPRPTGKVSFELTTQIIMWGELVL